jgi:hypothetical protein
MGAATPSADDPAASRDGVVNTLDELRETLVQITSELAGLNTDDGRVVRRIGSLIVEARELIGRLEAEMEVEPCRCDNEYKS